MREAEADTGRDEAGQPEAEGRESKETHLGQLRTRRLCKDIDLQKRSSPGRHERGSVNQSEIPQTTSKRIWEEILQAPVDGKYRMPSQRSMAHPPDL